jgi:hypothetical protein
MQTPLETAQYRGISPIWLCLHVPKLAVEAPFLNGTHCMARPRSRCAIRDALIAFMAATAQALDPVAEPIRQNGGRRVGLVPAQQRARRCGLSRSTLLVQIVVPVPIIDPPPVVVQTSWRDSM